MVTKVEECRYSDKDVNSIGDNLMKHDWARGGGMSVPRMRRPEDPSAGLIMEWASVASWFLKPDANLLPTTCASNNSVTNSSSNNSGKNNCRIPADIPIPFGPTICTAIRCTVPGCDCECFIPGKLHVRYCESCKHSWVPHALEKLGFRHVFAQTPIEPVQSNVVFDIASLVLYGCQALPIRLKILLDRLFTNLQKDEVTQILRGFGWSQEDYVRGYIMQEAHGAVLDHWNICSPEEEPLVLQQFLRFGETRGITQQLLMHGLGDLRQPPRSESDFKRMVEKSITKSLSANKISEDSSRTGGKYSNNLSSSSAHKLRNPASSPTNHSSSLLPPLPHISGKFSSLLPPQSLAGIPPHSLSPQQPPPPPPPKHSPLNFVKLPQTGLTCTPITTSTNGPISSSLNSTSSTTSVNMSPLNKLQNMQPFDFRQIASGIFQTSKPNSERRRPSETSETSQSGLNLCVTSPSTLLPHPPMSMPPISAPYNASSVGSKSPVIDFSNSKGSSEFGSEDGYEEEEESPQNALNLSKDASPRLSKQRHGHSRKASTPVKRQWGSSNLPLNLGTQLINPATGKKRVQCNVCLKTFCDKGALKIHFSAVHLREMHKCTVEGCNMMFSSRRSRNRHSANPNPKLHSPHLRRKISPHDGRSAQAHPILMPPLQAGLNPLAFGTFPLLTPPDLRHSLSGLDLKQSFDFNNVNSGMKFDESMDNPDDYMEYDDEDGIIVDDAGVDDDENYSETNSGDKAESTQSKRIKMSESDVDEDGASNTDSNESNSVLSDPQPLKEENDSRSRNSRKRKSQKPTRFPMRPVSTDDEQLSDAYSDDMIFSSAHSGNGHGGQVDSEVPNLEQEKEWDLSKSTTKVEEGVEAVSPAEPKEPVGEMTKTEDKASEEDEKKIINSSQNEQCLNLCKNIEAKAEVCEEREKTEEDQISVTENDCYDDEKHENTEEEPLNFADDAEVSSLARSNHGSGASTASCDSEENFDDENGVYGHFENGTFISSSEVPLDKDNPRKCTACSKVFQNHFGVKTHFQNVHLKLMHKCNVDGCNAAFPSKRSRDRHSSNLNLHRKLLSTSDSSGLPSFGPTSLIENQSFNLPPPPPTTMPNDFLSRLYGEGQNLPLNCPISATSPKTANGELVTSHPSLMIPPLAGLPFTALNPYTSPHLCRTKLN